MKEAPVGFDALLREAVTKPGRLAECYQMFHNYSIGNQLLAMWQLDERKLPIGPIASYKRWSELGRQVRRGEKAIVLCMPITRKKEDDAGEERVWKQFVFRPNWFALAQTDPVPSNDGAGLSWTDPEPLPDWDYLRAMEELGIIEVAFTSTDGNMQGYARPDERTLAINPVASHAWRTRIHEMAHCLLHSEKQFDDGATILRNEAELEAEAVSYIVGSCLALPGAEESRGYIQHWYDSREVPEKMAIRIFKTADRILRSGRPVETNNA